METPSASQATLNNAMVDEKEDQEQKKNDLRASTTSTLADEETVRLLVDKQQDMQTSMRAMQAQVSRMKGLLIQAGLPPEALDDDDDDDDDSPPDDVVDSAKTLEDDKDQEIADDDAKPEQPVERRRRRSFGAALAFGRLFGGGKKEDDGDDEEDDDLMDTLPEDSFSMMLVSPVFSIPFMSASGVLWVQLLAYLLLVWNQFQSADGSIFPTMVTPAVRFTQIIALIITALTQDLLRTGLVEFHKGYVPETVGQSFKYISRTRWNINCSIRCVEGSLGLVVTFILIMTATTVIDLLLNFTAMEFVSQLDEIFFNLALSGFVGKKNRVKAEVVANTKYKTATRIVNGTEERRTYGRLYLILVAVMGLLLAGWSVVVYNQSAGIYFCQTIEVQFDDEFVTSLGAFAGLYDLVPNKGFAAFSGKRSKYSDRLSGKAFFAYCQSDNAWTFGYRGDGQEPDPCKDWVLLSAQTDTFDVVDLANLDWTVRSDDREINLDHFHLKCMDCGNAVPGQPECYGRGSCSDAVCECDQGWYGLRCEFHEPCTDLEVDVRFDGFEDAREWSTSYTILKNGEDTVTAYSHPVYIGVENPDDVLAFTGRRWMATYAQLLDLDSSNIDVRQPDEDKIQVREEASARFAEYFLNGFHAYWSNFEVSFLTEPTDIGTELNSVQPTELAWYAALSKSEEHPHDLQGIDRAIGRVKVALLCSVCDHDENPCRSNGVCVEGKCQCAIGSEGGLCQVPPVGNGRCDPDFDIPTYGWDGGDCCEFSCISGDVFRCGKDADGMVDVGFPFCKLRDNTWFRNRKNFDGLKTESRLSVSLSRKGNILALGEPNADSITLYDSDGSEWIQRGRTLDGPMGSYFGSHISMSRGLSDTVGNPLAVNPVRISATGRFHDKGFVRVYECMKQGCMQPGGDVFVENLEESSRVLHALSNDGQTLAFGGFDEDEGRTTIRFYHFDMNLGVWAATNSTPPFQYAGNVYALAFSDDFTTLAIRSLKMREETEDSADEEFRQRTFKAFDGHAVFRHDSSLAAWVTLGQVLSEEIDGQGRSEFPEDFHIRGTRHRLSEYILESNPVSLSDDGLSLAVGYSISRNTPGVKVFAFDQQSNTWIRKGREITNGAMSGFKGWSVAFSGDGSVLVVGTGGTQPQTETYTWNGETWQQYGFSLPGGPTSSFAISADSSVLAIGSDSSVDLFHRHITPKCSRDEVPFHLSLSLDTRPEDTHWDLISNRTNEIILSGGPYEGFGSSFPYSTAYERATVVADQCIQLHDNCFIFSLYDSINPLSDDLEKPDGMLMPAFYAISVNNTMTKGLLDQAVTQVRIGDGCSKCPEGTQSFKLLVRSCVPFSWTLIKVPRDRVLEGENSQDFGSSFQYTPDQTCHKPGLTVKTYWKETCLSEVHLENECFSFNLGPHPRWVLQEPASAEGTPEPLEHPLHTIQTVMLLDENEIHVGVGHLGPSDGLGRSEINAFFGGGCDPSDNGPSNTGTESGPNK